MTDRKTSKGSSGRSYRGDAGLHSKVKKKRGLTASSRRWIERQINDPYVAEARSKGYRSRAALKLEQIDQKYHLFKPGQTVLDLGCAPVVGFRSRRNALALIRVRASSQALICWMLTPLLTL